MCVKVEVLSPGVLLEHRAPFNGVDVMAHCIFKSASYKVVVNKYEFAALPP